MHNKYAIAIRESKLSKFNQPKWLNFDIFGKPKYDKKFIYAHLFNSMDEAEKIFDEYTELNIKHYQVFRLEIFAQPLTWKE